MAWIHGSVDIHGRVVEVIQIQHMRRGLPPRPGGWQARIKLERVTIETDQTHESAKAAEDALLHDLRKWLSEEM